MPTGLTLHTVSWLQSFNREWMSVLYLELSKISMSQRVPGICGTRERLGMDIM